MAEKYDLRRKQIYLERRLEEQLKLAAKRTGIFSCLALGWHPEI